jgi:tetratricopeptide (TPR) repeat protein
MISGAPDRPNDGHQAYLRALGSMREDDAAWAPTLAGFVTLRLVDTWAEATRGRVTPPLPAEIAAVRRAIEDLPGGTERSVLSRVVDAVSRAWGQRLSGVSARVLAYAMFLYDAEQWSLAADVYRTFLGFASGESDMELMPQALVKLGTALMMVGELTQATEAHDRARGLAAERGDRYAQRLAEHGLAVIAIQTGNLPAADDAFGVVQAACEQELEAVPSLLDVLARVLHDRGWLALRRRQVGRAFRLLYEALERTRDARRRDRVLNDIGTAFLDIGEHAAARAAFAILEQRAEQKDLRWISALNLMHLSALEGAETTFERYRRALAKAPLPPRLAVDFQIYLGEGCARFGRTALARKAFDDAIGLAERYRLNEKVIEGEVARKALEDLARVGAITGASIDQEPVALDPDVTRVARAIGAMSEALAGVGQ